MRIVGGRDYYDTALAFGRDTDLVFVRTGKVIKPEGPLMPHTFRVWLYPGNYGNNIRALRHYNEFSTRSHTFCLQPIEVLFCGKRYGGVYMSAQDKDIRQPFQLGSYIWSFDELMRILNESKTTLEPVRKPRWYWGDKTKPQTQQVKDFFEDRGSPALQEYLINNKITTAVWCEWQDENAGNSYQGITGKNREYSYRCNMPNLKNVEFFKVIDAYTAFQEISMWVGGVLPKDGPPMVEITDPLIKIAKHGMDKWSFRKPGRKGM